MVFFFKLANNLRLYNILYANGTIYQGRKMDLFILADHQFVMIVVLMVVFILALAKDKKMIALFISFSFLIIGSIMFFSGFGKIGGFEGLAVTLAGFIYGVVGLVSILIISFVIYFRSKSETNSIDRF